MRRKAIIALVFLVAAAVLVESWHAAANAAATGGRPWPWLWPVTLEAFIFVLVLVYWDARSVGHRARTARVFLVLTTAVASAVQILDAPAHWLGWVTAGWTPVALLLSVEFAVGRLYRPDPIPTPLGHPVPDDPAPEPDADQPDQGQPRPKTRTNGTRFTADQRQRIAAMVAREASAKEIQRDLGVSDRAYRDHLLPLVRSLKGDLVRTSGGGS
jgi:hypothetical protein